jgi:hypothetical protein
MIIIVLGDGETVEELDGHAKVCFPTSEEADMLESGVEPRHLQMKHCKILDLVKGADFNALNLNHEQKEELAAMVHGDEIREIEDARVMQALDAAAEEFLSKKGVKR